MPICLRLLLHWARAAAARTFWTAGTSRPIRMAMMAITTNNSISVKAERARLERAMTNSSAIREMRLGMGHQSAMPIGRVGQRPNGQPRNASRDALAHHPHLFLIHRGEAKVPVKMKKK